MSTHHSNRQSRHQQGAPSTDRGRFKAESRPATDIDLFNPAGANIYAPQAASSPNISRADLAYMLEPDQPVKVRASAARMAEVYGGLSEKLAQDPSPYIRSLALISNGLSRSDRQRLEQDQQVQSVLKTMTGRTQSA